MAAATIGAARIEMSINSTEFISQMKRMASQVGKFEASLDGMGRKFQRAGRNMERIGSRLNRNVTLPIAAAGGASLKSAIDFESSMTRIQTLVGIASERVDEMRESVLDLARESGQAPRELSEALFTVTSAGARGAEAMQILERSAKAAAIGLGDTQQIARAVTAAMQAYGSETLSAARATDTLTAIVREGNLEAESLAPVLGRVVGIASQLGISFEELGASIATYTRLGVSAEEATTGIRSLMNALLKPSEQARKVLAQVGLTFEELRARVQDDGLAATMTDLISQFEGNEEALSRLIPNVRALSAVLGTAGAQGAEYQRIQQRIAESMGIVDKGFEDVSDTVQQKFNKALANLRANAIEVGAKLLPVASKLLDRVNSLATGFGNLSDTSKANIIIFGGLAAAAGPVISGLGKIVGATGTLMRTLPKVTKAVKALTAAMIAHPYIAVGAVIAGIAAASWKANEAIKAFHESVENMRIGTVNSWQDVNQKIIEVEERMEELRKGAAIAGFSDPRVNKEFVALEKQLERLIDLRDKLVLDEMMEKTAASAEKARDSIAAIPTEFSTSIEAAGFVETFSTANTLIDQTADGLDRLKAKTGEFETISEAALAGIRTNWERTMDVIQGFSDQFKSLIMDQVASGVIAFGETIGRTLAGVENKFMTTFERIALIMLDFAKQIARLGAAIGAVLLLVPGGQGAGAGLLAASAAVTAAATAVEAGIQRRASNREARSKAAGMAQGGIVPPGFPNDSYPAGLTSGERVIPDPIPLSRGSGGDFSGKQMERSMEKAMRNALDGARWKVSGSDLVLVTARSRRYN